MKFQCWNLYTLNSRVLKHILKFLFLKTVVSTELLCSKCRQKVMKLIAKLEGITSICLDLSKNRVTVVADANPLKIINMVSKFRTDTVVSIGTQKDEKKYASSTSNTCKRCDVWSMIAEDGSNYCSLRHWIMDMYFM